MLSALLLPLYLDLGPAAHHLPLKPTPKTIAWGYYDAEHAAVCG